MTDLFKTAKRVLATASLLVLATSATASAAIITKTVEKWQHYAPFGCSATLDQFVLDGFRSTKNCGGIAVSSGPGWIRKIWPGMVNSDFFYITGATMNGKEYSTFSPTIKRTGLYEVWADWRSSENRSGAAPFYVYADDGNIYKLTVNQKHEQGYNAWAKYGTFRFNARAASAKPLRGYVKVASGGQKSAIDAVYFKYVGPAVVTGLDASDGTSAAGVNLKWTAGYKVKNYQVYRNTVNNQATSTKIGSPVTNSFTDVTATAGVTYYYWVRAYSTFLKYSAFSAAEDGYRSLAVPANVHASTTTVGQIDVTWDAVAGAASYKVYRNTPDDVLATAVPVGSPTTNAFTDTVNAITPTLVSTDYYYYVSAVGANGLPGIASTPGAHGFALP